MRIWIISPIIAIGFLASGGESRGQTPTVSVETEYLATVELPVELPQSAGSRVIVNVPAGGTVRGPKINGTFVAPAGDWLIVMPNGSPRLDVRATIKTDDGEIILVTYSGAIPSNKEVNDRFNNGEVIASKDAKYFITAPQFTTGSKKYDWLNQIQAVGKMVSLQRGVNIKYDWFIVR